MPSLDDYAVFVQIMDARSISTAAKKQGISVQNASRALARLEAQLGVTLARRTTRTFVPTEAGTRLLARLRRVIDELRLADEEMQEETSAMKGEIKVSSSTLFGPRYIVPAISAFVALHPGVRFALRISDRFDDPLATNVDMALRIGVLTDSSLVAKLIGKSRRVVFASQSYLERRGEPSSPGELAAHDCIVRTDTRDNDRWRFGTGTAEKLVSVGGAFTTDSAAACNAAVLAGMGVGSGQFWQIREQVEDGRLRLLLTDFEAAPLPVQVVWPKAKKPTARTRRFVDFLAQFIASDIS